MQECPLAYTFFLILRPKMAVSFTTFTLNAVLFVTVNQDANKLNAPPPDETRVAGHFPRALIAHPEAVLMGT